MAYRSKVRLHATRDGRVVPPGHPESAILLVPAGGEISDEKAKKYGLMGDKAANNPAPGEEALPLDSPPSPTPPSTPSTQGIPTSTDAAKTAGEGFPQNLQFGTPSSNQATGQPVAPQPATPPGTPVAPVAPVAPATTVSTPQVPPPPPSPQVQSDIPDDFPYKSILMSQGIATKAQLKEITKEQLLTKNQIGAQRADEILAAREKL